MKKSNFPQLPLLDYLGDILYPEICNYNLDSTYIICIQHILESTGSLIVKLIDLGFPPENVFLLGKYYSTSPEVESDIKHLGIYYFDFELQRNTAFNSIFKEKISQMLFSISLTKKFENIQNIIVLDEGGFCLEALKAHPLLNTKKIIGIEQTKSGLYKKDAFRNGMLVIEVANSAAKKFLESKIIISDAITKIQKKLDNFRNKRIGIIGLGALGRNLLIELYTRGFKVFGYDIKEIPGISKENLCLNPIELIQKSDIIIGCTGVDISSIDWFSIGQEKTFVSCSSTDIEFYTIIEYIRQNFHSQVKPLYDIEVKINDKNFQILNGGFPITFDRNKTAVDSYQIQLTRGLNLIAIYQALIYLFTTDYSVKTPILNPKLQKIAAKKWFELLPNIKILYPEQIISNFDDEVWIRNNSES